VVVVVALVEPVTPELPPMELLPPLEPGPPMELVLSPLLAPGVVLLPPLLPGLVLLEVDVSGLGAGVLVYELDEDVVGVPA
jgi:hypothetical protein